MQGRIFSFTLVPMIHSYCRIFSFGILLSFLALSACVHQDKKQPAVKTDTVSSKNQSIKGNFSDQQDLHFDSVLIRSFSLEFPQLKSYSADLSQFYAYRNFRYAWYNKNGLVEQASNLLDRLNNLDQEGIQAAVPYKDVLDSLLNDPMPATGPDTHVEILLTAEYFFYADKVWNGISETKTTKLEWFLPRKKLNLPYMMDSLLSDTAASLFSASYSFRQYNLLKTELLKYRHLDNTGSWTLFNSGLKKLKKQDSSEMISEIRHRLYLLGDLAKDSRSNIFDDSLEAAVKSFQQRNGIFPDGVMGDGFIREINIPLREKISKLIINMERTRWIPINLSQRYIIINIPAFTLYAYDQDSLNFTMNVVVGKDVHKTVVFSGDIKYIVFSPYWNVPPSIMKNEILPAIRKNPEYVKKNNMEWNGNSIRQKPGPANSLGLVKFLFPNSYNIYLHDSPAKSLFGSQSRAFSHGCIRLAEPKKLAEYLLKDEGSWDVDKINAAMHAGKEKYVTLKNPVPVFIGYLTAWVDGQGRLNFRKDIYNRDQPLEELLIQK